METVTTGNVVTTTTTGTDGTSIAVNNEANNLKVFTQDEVDQIVKERLGRERNKYADYEAMKEKAAKFDEISEASKTELEKATERANKLQEELDGLRKAEEVRSIRDEVAKETGIPVHLLTAETKEDCEAQANAIMSFAKPDEGYPKVKDAGEIGKTSTGSTRQQFEEWFNEQL